MATMRRSIGFKAMMAGAGILVGASFAALAVASLWAQSLNQQLTERVDMARRQALQVTQLEADLGARLLAAPAQAEALDRDIRRATAAYLASIENERALLDDDLPSQAHQAREAEDARTLSALIGNGTDRQDFAQARALSRVIALRENAEAEAAARAFNRVQARTSMTIAVLCLAMILLYGAIALILWKGVLRPIAALAEAAGRVAREQGPTRVTPQGLGELKRLAGHFNHMAQAVEHKARQRVLELEKANRELIAIDGRRRLFLSKASHELRTPVTVIRGEAEVALRVDGDAPALAEALRHVVDNSIFLQRRLDDLLGLARAEDGALALETEPFDLAALVRHAGTVATPFARSSGIRLRVDGADRPLPAVGDAERLRQALVAVIDNSVKFSPPEGAVTLSVERTRGMARVAISDEGPGVPEEELARIFDPYVQTGAGRSRGGTGLGLSLARWIADRHGGSIVAANNRSGRGLCVSLTLPVPA